jgi:hypothetical protein
MVLSYPPLPSGDGLRVLTLSPGDFWDPLEGNLLSVSFASKPKYIALSYTWADPDPDHAEIPCMPPTESVAEAEVPGSPCSYHSAVSYMDAASPTLSGTGETAAEEPRMILNGESFLLQHNLCLALRFLRSSTHSFNLWIDAICINQASIPERNAQVALMAFIYTRASAVLSWLGVPERDYSGSSLEGAWEAGESRQIASWFADARFVDKDLFFLPSQAAPSETEQHVHGNPYWRRLWIAQEVCLSRTLAFVHGGKIWAEAPVRQPFAASDRMRSHLGGLPVAVAAPMSMEGLLAVREQRFDDETMRLEVLVERFMRSGCGEIRDRVFGLVGLASDVDSKAFALDIYEPHNHHTVSPCGGWTDDDTTALLENNRRSGFDTMGSAPKRGRATQEIDYERRFYDIWQDVVSHMHFQAKPLGDFGTGDAELDDERRIRLVRFAGIVQTALEGKVEEEARLHSLLPQGSRKRETDFERLVQAKGFVAGTVLHIGPSYDDFVGSHRAHESWKGSLGAHYQSANGIKKLRQMEEDYAAKIIEYTEHDLARICHISSKAVAWTALLPDPPLKPVELPDGKEQHQQTGSAGPVRFLGSDFCIGLAPSGVKVGDKVIRFWNCDATIIVRQSSWTKLVYDLIGRADVAKPDDGRIWDLESMDKRIILSNSGGSEDTQLERKGQIFYHCVVTKEAVLTSATVPISLAVPRTRTVAATLNQKDSGKGSRAAYVRMDFETLQRISASIVV